MTDLIDTTEMYLRVIAELEEEGITPMRARIAERLEQSTPTVSQTVGRMERDGLVTVAPDRSLSLSDEGRRQAIAVLRRHRLAECLLISWLGMPLEVAHVEACRWEHVLTPEVERRICQQLGHPNTTPYGTPIPGLDELGEDHAPEPHVLTPLTDAQVGQERVVGRLGENLQAFPDLLADVVAAGVVPGAQIVVQASSGVGMSVQAARERVHLPHAAAHDIGLESLS